MALNYAEKYTGKILEIINQDALTSPLITSNVEWLNAKTFHFTQQSVTGYQTHSRAGGWNRGTVTETDKAYTVAHDRDVEFLVDKVDVDETARTAAIENITNTFVRTQQTPEVDAYAFSTVATKAISAGLTEVKALSTITGANAYSYLVSLLGKAKLKYYRQRGSLIGYVRSEIMDALAVSTEMKPNIQADSLTEKGIETRIVKINGVTLIEVIDDDRFQTVFDYTNGFEADGSAKQINVLLLSVETCFTVPKINSIYYFNAGQHTEGDGDLYQNRALWDTFVFPNGKDGNIDSVYCVTES